MKELYRKSWFVHVAAFIIILLTICIYFSPVVFSGKVLKQHDTQQWQASYHEVGEFQKQSGERTFWTNSIFGGMPIYLIGPSYHHNYLANLDYFLHTIFPGFVIELFILFFGFYLLLLSFDVNPWLSIGGALAFTLSTNNIINIEVGHATKSLCIALGPLLFAGINITLKKHLWIGAVITAFALAYELVPGHFQITYYLMLIVGVWMIAEAIAAFRNKTQARFFKSMIVLAMAAAIASGTHITHLLATQEYGQYSTRSKSELVKKLEQNGIPDDNNNGGLDKDYALQWSNGVSEPLTLLVPNFHGGSGSEKLSTSSETYKLLKQNGVPNAKQIIQGLPMYWGTQPFTAGPIYFGALICFFFVFGLFVVKGETKWWIFIISALAIGLSMGKNFMSLTDIFFYHFPLYNKFRSVTFILAICQITFPLLGFMAVNQIISGKTKKEDAKKYLLYTLYIVGGLCAVMVLLPGLFSDFTSPNIDKSFPEWLQPAILADRESMLRMDALRSLVFILLGVGLLWFYLAGKVKQSYVFAGLILLCTLDLWGIDKRYLNDNNFEAKKKSTQQLFPKSMADEMILQDTSLNYRVYNTTQRLDQDALTSYYHKSIGGYHGAKMKRYQELIEYQISRGNMEMFNMLNVKYFIVGDSSGNQYAQINPQHNGNAWFVKNYMIVPDADAEIDSLTNFNSKETAVIDQRFSDQINGMSIFADSLDQIGLIAYQPNKLTYRSNASSDRLAVFSEIFYDKGWNAYVDGELMPHFRCNYVLRGMKIPAGNHEVVFKFEPQVVVMGERISLVSSVILFGGMAAILIVLLIRRPKETKIA